MDLPKALDLEKSASEFRRAGHLVPGGVLGIRRPYNFVPGEYPNFFESGSGGHTVDIDGNDYIDYLCGYGPIVLGYRESEVDEAVIRQIRDRGNCFSLSQTLQNDLAERIAELMPCAEKSIFVKTGSDATTLAVRIARGHTNRTKVIRCGYHGWHDWCVEVKGGVPSKLFEDTYEFAYNDLDGLEELLRIHGDEAAAIIVTPYGHELGAPMEEPKPGFLEGVRRLADRHGCVLIFDEIRTGFRMTLGGAQKFYGVTPDVACVGKAMANGYAISAVVGKSAIMDVVEKKVFVSSTFFPNAIGYVAAMKTIDILQRDNVLAEIRDKGMALIDRLTAAADRTQAGARVSGNGWMFFVTFDKDDRGTYKERRDWFHTFAIRSGVFIQPYHHGYVCHRHTIDDIDRTCDVLAAALAFAVEQAPD